MATIKNLSVCQVTDEWAANTCGPYYFLVQTYGTTPHTAFCTEHGFMKWLSERGLSLTKPLVVKGEHQYQKIEGSYIDNMMSDVEAFNQINPIIETRVMSNGDYTLAKITENSEGVRVLNYLNCTCERVKFDYQESRKAMS